ncbi:hypothetical protein FE257_001481 [Aspergillus nanangensis]|uniref:Uncharacterized protein n=1 Tax=Aspergillus nanangensis TaxID=2582783 RepID=A0AAD4CDM3_ASPNN|nr:hypothetical protein FE257_001481 [Aspergillus nanangensis]
MVKGRKDRQDAFPRIFTCPNEMVALSMAYGHARVTNEPQKSTGPHLCRTITFHLRGEMRGSRTEYIHWLQHVPDQKQIIVQCCRYVGEICTGKNIKQMVGRALQFATSSPKGPAYLTGAREVMEEEIEPYSLPTEYWKPVVPGALPASAVEMIAKGLVQAKHPLLITGYSGRNHDVVQALVD